MKNRNKLRHIIINNKEYLWNYYYDDMDFSNFPYSYYLFVPINNRKLKVSVYFKKYMPQMNLDVYTSEGTPCLYKNKPVVLNLCRPFYGGQVIEYVFKNRYKDTDIGEFKILDGDNILEQLGYSDF